MIATVARRAAELRDLGVGLAVAGAAAAPTALLTGRPAVVLGGVALLWWILSTLVLWGVSDDAPGPGIGWANRVTMLRGALVTPVAALALRPAPLSPGAAWWVIALSTVALLLDGVDGRVARRTGTATPFGARFDMELDAALIMALSVLVWAQGVTGPWILAMGLMRYAFVAAGWVVVGLRGSLPESLRRKAVCVMQGVVLLVALGPVIPAPVGAALCAVGLAVLTWSFGVDVAWLLRQGREAGEASRA